MELNFQGPYVFHSDNNNLIFNEPISHQAGIYLWAINYKNGYLIEYIGETGVLFYKRMKEHFIQTVGGNYRICDPQSLKEGKVKIIWNGMWRKGTRDKMPSFLNSYTQLCPVIQNYLKTVEIFLAPFEADRKLRRRIEGAIAKFIKEQPSPIGDLLPSDIRYTLRKKSEKPIAVQLKSSKKIFGFPAIVEA